MNRSISSDALHISIGSVESFTLTMERADQISRSKGELISKGLFGFFNSPKKRTKFFCSNRLGQKLTFSSSFFW